MSYEEIPITLDENGYYDNNGEIGTFDIPGDGIEGVRSEGELVSKSNKTEKEQIKELKRQKAQVFGAFALFAQGRRAELENIDLEEAA